MNVRNEEDKCYGNRERHKLCGYKEMHGTNYIVKEMKDRSDISTTKLMPQI